VPPTHALVRPPSPSYVAYYADRGVAICKALAEDQHRKYVQALEEAGLQVSRVEPAVEFPDCVFVEDAVVVWGGSARVARMAPHREGEQAAVAAALQQTHRLMQLPLTATLDGGDVLHAEGVTYVGLSSRTNERGAKALAQFLEPFGRPVVPIAVRNCLHLKSAATYLGDGTLLAEPSRLDEGGFTALDVILTDPEEPGCANCLRVGDRLLIRAGYPRTRERLERFAGAHRLQVVALEASEFEKGGGSLTCLSVIW
jgi:dimethylargininase